MKRLLIALALVAVSCSPKVFPTEVRDSVRVEIRERLVHDSVYVEIEKQVEKIVTRDTLSHLENDYAESDAAYIGGILSHSLSSKPQRIYVPYTVEVHDTAYVETHAETIVQEVNRLTKWQSFSMVLGWILGGLLVLLVALKAALRYIAKK